LAALPATALPDWERGIGSAIKLTVMRRMLKITAIATRRTAITGSASSDIKILQAAHHQI
ncbi:MAG: hypothetical protein Q4P78_07975, partial [Rothia sp. (in: high G+C Gram-positive bacteria)]|uniref:hypothetical protein n=1 Tax=Rothia sp. (in: high G+C Gram-positive bacteria) TaxID=1885016 RepID=UPI0026DEA481